MDNQSSKPRLKVAVLFGGRSPEHEISIISASQVIGFLTKSYDIVPIYITKEGKWLTHESFAKADGFKNFKNILKRCSPIAVTPDTDIQVILNPLGKGSIKRTTKLDVDVIFPVLHGMHGEDGSIQGLLELTNIPYVGSNILASAIGIDKVATKKMLASNGIQVVDYYAFSRREWEDDEEVVRNRIIEKFSFPVIVKPARLGSSIAIEVANDIDELNLYIGIASKYDTKILIEPYLKNCIEVNCSVLGYEHPIASVLEKPAKKDRFLSFKDKYIQGDRQSGMEGAKREIPAPIPDEQANFVKELALKTFQAIGCAGIARIDFLIDLDSDNVFVNEINTLPGSISYYLWNRDENGDDNFSPEMLVSKLIGIALDIFREKQRTRFNSDNYLIENIDFLSHEKG